MIRLSPSKCTRAIRNWLLILLKSVCIWVQIQRFMFSSLLFLLVEHICIESVLGSNTKVLVLSSTVLLAGRAAPQRRSYSIRAHDSPLGTVNAPRLSPHCACSLWQRYFRFRGRHAHQSTSGPPAKGRESEIIRLQHFFFCFVGN